MFSKSLVLVYRRMRSLKCLTINNFRASDETSRGHLKMGTLDDWVVKMDLKDAYFHGSNSFGSFNSRWGWTLPVLIPACYVFTKYHYRKYRITSVLLINSYPECYRCVFFLCFTDYTIIASVIGSFWYNIQLHVRKL